MTTTVILAGLFDLALAAFHVAFWRLFGWPERLRELDRVNRGIMQVLNLALIALFALLGLIFVLNPADATATPMGRWLLAGLALFWLARAAIQRPFFGLKHPLSIALTLAFIAGGVLHAVPFWLARG